MRIKAVLRKIFAGTQYENNIEEIQNMFDEKEENSKIIYLDSLHLFGRKGNVSFPFVLKLF